MKLLGEKELEIEVLRELLKKRTRITRKKGSHRAIHKALRKSRPGVAFDGPGLIHLL